METASPATLNSSCSIPKSQMRTQSEEARAKNALDLLTAALINEKGVIGVGTNADNAFAHHSITVLIDGNGVAQSLRDEIPHRCLGIPVKVKQSAPFKAQ